MESLEIEVCEDAGKRDQRGRRIVRAERRRVLIEEYRESGLTQKAFCRREGINLNTFVGWLSQQRAANAEQPGGPGSTFREVVWGGGTEAAAPGMLEGRLPGGEVVRGTVPEAVAKLVGLLRG